MTSHDLGRTKVLEESKTITPRVQHIGRYTKVKMTEDLAPEVIEVALKFVKLANNTTEIAPELAVAAAFDANIANAELAAIQPLG